jgi:hypothetical protein
MSDYHFDSCIYILVLRSSKKWLVKISQLLLKHKGIYAILKDKGNRMLFTLKAPNGYPGAVQILLTSLLKRQGPGRSAYDCHLNCGNFLPPFTLCLFISSLLTHISLMQSRDCHNHRSRILQPMHQLNLPLRLHRLS